MEQKITRRQKLIDNTLNLSINTGKINEKINFILYSEEDNNSKKQKIGEIKEDINSAMKNLENIAEILEI